MPSQVCALHRVGLGIGNACWDRVVEPLEALTSKLPKVDLPKGRTSSAGRVNCETHFVIVIVKHGQNFGNGLQTITARTMGAHLDQEVARLAS